MHALKLISAGLAVSAAALPVAAIAAPTIYQSTPYLNAAPITNGYCSQCGSDGQSIGGAFSLSSSALAKSLLFAVTNNYNFPTSVTVGIYQDAGGVVGAQLYGNTFSSFGSSVDTGKGTNVLGVNIGNVALAAGNYYIFFTNPTDLAIPAYGVGDGALSFVSVGGPNPPLTGSSVGNLAGNSIAYSLSSSVLGTVPEPATWAMMIGGFGVVGGAMRRRKSAVRTSVRFA